MVADGEGHHGRVLIRDCDAHRDDEEWRTFVTANAFGHLVAAGTGRAVPVVVPTQFVLQDDSVILHLARPNSIWEAIEENPTVVMSVAGDWAFVPSAWKAVGDEDPRRGVPTTYYAAVQLIGDAEIVDDPAQVAGILRCQLADLQPDVDAIDPIEHGNRLRGIRGIRISVTDVRAKFKYGDNVDEAHRLAIHDRLLDRDGPGDRAAARHLIQRLHPEGG